MVTTTEYTNAIEVLFDSAFATNEEEPLSIAELVVDGMLISADLVLNPDGIPGADVLFTLEKEM